jgi:hypothetical protein
VTNRESGVFTKDDWIRGVQIRFPDSQPVEILEVSSIH